MRNRAVEHNVAAFSELSLIAVRWQGRLVLRVTTLIYNGKLLTTAVMVDNLAKKVDKCPLNRGLLFAYSWDPESCLLYGVERWPRNRGFLSTILNGDAG